jgi:hypothetical protein
MALALAACAPHGAAPTLEVDERTPSVTQPVIPNQVEPQPAPRGELADEPCAPSGSEGDSAEVVTPRPIIRGRIVPRLGKPRPLTKGKAKRWNP